MNPQSLNPYVYCLNNPLKYVDPDGESPWDYIALPDGAVAPDEKRLEEYMEEIRSGDHNFDEETVGRIREWSHKAYEERTRFGSRHLLKTKSIGVEGSLSLGFIGATKYSFGVVSDTEGKTPYKYGGFSIGAGGGYSASIVAFISSSESYEFANQEQIPDYNLEVSLAFISIEYQKAKNGDFTVSFGFGIGYGGFYWRYRVND